MVKLSSNESAFAPLPSVRLAIERSIADVHRYPDFPAHGLIEALAEHLRVDQGMIAVDSGSSALCRAVIETAISPGEEVVMARPTYELYERFTVVAGARPVPVPLDALGRHDLGAMRDALGPETRAVFICNPNNPTGTTVSDAALRHFLDDAPPDVLVVLDEAYREFAGNAAASTDAATLVTDHDNLVVLRTFSKAYGLAGLRVGYAIGAPQFIVELHKVIMPFSVSGAAQRAAIASLQSGRELQERIVTVVEERARMTSALRRMGLLVPDSAANFVWIGLGADSDGFVRCCEAGGVLIRHLPPDGARVTVGTREENDRFLVAAGSWMPPGS